MEKFKSQVCRFCLLLYHMGSDQWTVEVHDLTVYGYW